MSKEKISRRKYLKYTGGAIAAAAIAAAGYGAYKYSEEPAAPTPERGKVVKIGGTKPFTGPDAPAGIAEGDGNNNVSCIGETIADELRDIIYGR